MNNKILIAIPCWRDPFVYETIKSAYDQAYDKNCLVFGVFFQGYPEDDWMINTLQEKLPEANIKIKKINGDLAPDYLCQIKRVIVDQIMTDESYYLQIDSHTKFRKNWDIMLKTELLIANRKFGKSIINSQTIYFNCWSDPLIDDPLTSYASNEEWNWIMETLNFTHPISLNGRVTVKPNNTMIKEKFYNGNMVFSYAYYTKEVPFPMEMAQCFEQQISMLRAYTAGYNVVSPTYQYTNNFNYWRDEFTHGDDFIRHIRWDRPEQLERLQAANQESFERYNSLFKNNNSGYRSDFGAFEVRSIPEYIEFIGYDPVTLEIKKSEHVDLDNAKFISDSEFFSTMKEIAYQSGYDMIEPKEIVNDTFTRRTGSTYRV
jgi:hypothetical protein